MAKSFRDGNHSAEDFDGTGSSELTESDLQEEHRHSGAEEHQHVRDLKAGRTIEQLRFASKLDQDGEILNPRPLTQCKGEGKERSLYCVTPPVW